MVLERVKALREDNDLSQEEFGKILHISQRAYSYYENGERTISPELLDNIATYFDTSVDYLLARTKQRKPYPKN